MSFSVGDTSLALLWRGWAGVLRRRAAVLLLLFLLGWAGYHLTVMLTGLVAVKLAWAVIPLMALGCLVQLVITLFAYRLSIHQAEDTLGVAKLPEISFAAMLSRLLVPFAAIYSVFGFFESYARDGVQAAAAMVGTLADFSFLLQVNPFASTKTLVVVVACFIVLWVVARLIKRAANQRQSVGLALLSAFASACVTFLILLSISRVINYLTSWLDSRVFMAWRDQFLHWLGSILRFDVPEVFALCWHWLANTAWPIFWQVMSQPLLWLTVVALVGGMQFTDIDTVWNKADQRLMMRQNHRMVITLAQKVSRSVDGIVEALLPFCHLLTVVVRSSVSFLGALVISFTAINQVGAWLDHAIQRLIGPVSAEYAFLISPLLYLMSMVVTAMAQAVLLSVAYVRLRQIEQTMTVKGSKAGWWKSLVAMVVSLAIAIGISLADPGSPNPVHQIKAGQPVQLLANTVTVSDLRVGRSLTGVIPGQVVNQPIPSLGIFVAVKVSVEGRKETAVGVSAQSGDLSYPLWDSTTSNLTAWAGFRTTADLVFEVASLDNLQIIIVPAETLPMMIPIGSFPVPADTVVSDLIEIDQTRIREVVT